MELIIGEFIDEALNVVGPALGVAFAIAKLSGLRPQFSSRVALRLVHVPVRIRLMHGQSFERFASASLSDLASLLDRTFQLPPEICGKNVHTITGPFLSFSSTCFRTSVSHCSNSAVLWMVALGSHTR